MSASVEPCARPRLSLLLRSGTGARHRLAEETPFVRSLLAGRVGRARYARFVESLYFVYAAMEGALDRHREHPALAPLDLPGLRRLPSLEHDLRWWSGPDWHVAASPSPATRTYVARIEELASTSPALLVGHLYTRYLGDLSGGQLIGRALERRLELLEASATTFYRFEDGARLRERFRSALDRLPVDETSSALIVGEACRAFDHNVQVLEELATV